MTTTQEKPKTQTRLTPATAARLDRLNRETKRDRTSLLDEAVSLLETKLFWDNMDKALETHGEALRAEYAVYEGTNMDGLESV